jgi:3-phosphoglycerate kinase
MRFIDNGDLVNKKVLVRVDFNVSLNTDGTISNDERIKQTLPTLRYLLDNGNTLILMSHLGNPKQQNDKYSLGNVTTRLQTYLPDYTVLLKNDLTPLENTSQKTIIMLENLRFNPGEKANDAEFAKQLASLADAYVNDAFSASHRPHASIVGVPLYLPSYAGFLLKKEIEMIGSAIKNPRKPLVAILGGAKISTKLKLIGRFIDIADHIILAGGLAHNFFLAEGKQIGKSISEPDEVEHTKTLFAKATQKHVDIALPTDVIIQTGETKGVDDITETDQIFDVGPESRVHFSNLIKEAKTVIWNGPLGMFEDAKFRGGTDAVYTAIISNPDAISVAGGGDTLAAIAGKTGRGKITHISTGGGAMLEFIENGTLPGIDALR